MKIISCLYKAVFILLEMACRISSIQQPVVKKLCVVCLLISSFTIVSQNCHAGWVPYDDFSDGVRDEQKWHYAYWEGGESPQENDGNLILSVGGGTGSVRLPLEVEFEQAGIDMSGVENHSLIGIKDPEITGVRLDIVLSGGAPLESGVLLGFFERTGPQEISHASIELGKWDDGVRLNFEKELFANGEPSGGESKLLPANLGETYRVTMLRDSGTIKVFKDTELIATYPSTGKQIGYFIAAFNDAGLPMSATADNVQVFYPDSAPAISAGGDSSFYLDADGRVWAVGDNEDGQLGDGTKNTAYAPRLIMSDVKAISAGDGYTLILKMDSTVWATGENWAGQLGDGTQTDKATPVKVMSEVHAISAGDEHSLFLKTDGTLWASGHNDDGQLGDGTKITRTIPVQIMADIQAMSAGGAFSIFLKTDGTVWASGENWAGQIGDGTYESRSTPIQIMSGVKAVAAGMDHGLYLKSDGSLWSVGGNWAGQLGDGTTTNRLAPIRVFSNVMAMAAGDDFSAIVTNEGDLFLAGDRGLGIQGIEPVKIMSDVQSVSAGADHLLILKNDGSIWAQGYNESGALGSSDPPMLVKPVVMMTGAKAVDAGAYHSLILKDDDTAWSVGDNFVGALGDGTFESRSNPVKVLADVQAVATGENHSLFLKKDGSVWISGVPLGTQLPYDYDYLYQVYREQSLVDESPEQFMTDVKAIASGVSHCLFLKIDGSVWAAGANWSGQLGIGSNEDQASAVKVMEDVKAVAAGDHHSFFLKNDGSLWGAGLNDEGQLGDGTLTNRNVPVFIMNDVKALSRPHAGDHSLFLKTDGSVWGTGRNSSGELGIGSYLSVNVPTKVMDGAIDMAVGSSHSLYLKADKTLWASGANESGQMGNGSTNGSNIPILVMTNVRSMSCGEIHSLFLKEDGTVLASGNRYYGKLGDSYEHDEFTPVESFRILVNAPWGSNADIIRVDPPVIAIQPSGAIFKLGGSTNFSVTATGTNLSYQWKRNGADLAGETGAQLFLNNLQGIQAGSYTVVVSNSAGSVTSNDAQLAVVIPPRITAQPAAATANQGASASFSVTATGTNLSYQWKRNGADLAGETGATLSLNNLQGTQTGNYTVAVSNAIGSETSTAAQLTVVIPPRITAQPAAATANQGASASFSVTATGTNLSYQWKRNGADLAGETGDTLVLDNLQGTQTGFYTVVVSNAIGSVTGDDALLTVVIPPAITAQPAAATANQGASASFSVTATGTILSYQWKRNGADLAGETGVMLSLNNLQGTQAGSYTVAVSNSAGSVTSNAAVLTVLGITSDLDRLILNVGAAMSYVVTANPAPTTYAAKSLPAGLKINAKTGVIFGKPTKAGEYTVILQALRKGAATLSAVKTFRVLQAPTFKLPAKVNVTRNKAFRSAPKVSAYPTASFSVFSGDLPEGITLNPTTGQISGKTVTLKGNYPVTIRGSNEAGKTDVKTVLVVK